MEASDVEDMKFLRRHGWRIKKRPAIGEPIWEQPPCRLVLPQTEAIEHVVAYLTRIGKLK